MRMNDTSRINKDCATIAQSACVRRANQMSTKTKKSNKIVPMFDGCMNGRMSLFRKCVEQKKTTQETLEILRKKYPWGLTGTNAIRWITKHYMRIERKERERHERDERRAIERDRRDERRDRRRAIRVVHNPHS